MANKQQQQKLDKKQRKLTKSPQVSCDISMLSSSPTQCGASPSSLTSPKYVAYPSSLPNHDATTDENLIKNFEYSRSDLTLTDRISPSSYSSTITTITQQQTASSSQIPSPKRCVADDVTHIHQRFPSFSKKTIDCRPKPNEIYYRIDHNAVEPHAVKPNILYVENPVTMPTCCIKNAQSLANNNSGNTTADVVMNKNPHISTAPSTYQQHHHQTSPLSSSSATTILNDQLRNIRQMIHAAANSTTHLVGTNYNPSKSTTTNATQHQQSSSVKPNFPNENAASTNPFLLANLFKTSDKSTSTSIAQTTTMAATALPQSSAVSSPNSSTLCENYKRDEFLKATMKICLVVSPPSNKLLQVRKLFYLNIARDVVYRIFCDKAYHILLYCRIKLIV